MSANTCQTTRGHMCQDHEHRSDNLKSPVQVTRVQRVGCMNTVIECTKLLQVFLRHSLHFSHQLQSTSKPTTSHRFVKGRSSLLHLYLPKVFNESRAVMSPTNQEWECNLPHVNLYQSMEGEVSHCSSRSLMVTRWRTMSTSWLLTEYHVISRQVFLLVKAIRHRSRPGVRRVAEFSRIVWSDVVTTPSC